jgi:hypothetical protein
VHLDSPDAEGFNGMDIDLTYLQDWFPTSGWEMQLTVSEK